MPQFPPDFLWGAATAAHQVEGNNVNSDWWVLEHTPGTTIVEPSGDACDSYHRYREEMSILARLGFNAYRFSLEWARIEPEPGCFSLAEIDHYRRMVAACHEFGLTPVVTLLHFTVPRWMRDRGMWRHPDAGDIFGRYVEKALDVLSEGVEWVCTINEPNIAAMLAGGENSGNLVAHGLPAPDPLVADTLVAAHGIARQVLSTMPTIRSGWTVATQAFQPEPGCEDVARAYGYPREEFYLEAARGDDFIGVQAYTRTIIGPDGPRPVRTDVETTLTGWEFYPPALGIGVRNAWAITGGVPVMVTENGIATHDDTRRIAYTAGALSGLHDAMVDGVDVRGYLHWSALDNFEWASGFAPTFGLIAVDRETFVRTAKPSASWLGQVAQTGSLSLG